MSARTRSARTARERKKLIAATPHRETLGELYVQQEVAVLVDGCVREPLYVLTFFDDVPHRQHYSVLTDYFLLSNSIDVAEDPSQQPLMVNLKPAQNPSALGRKISSASEKGAGSPSPSAAYRSRPSTGLPAHYITASTVHHPHLRTGASSAGSQRKGARRQDAGVANPMPAKPPQPIVTPANCKTRHFPRQQRRINRVLELETALKVASEGGVALVEGLEGMVSDDEKAKPFYYHVPASERNAPPLPSLQTPKQKLATKALLKNLEENGGLTLEQAAVVRRVIAVGDKNRRKLVAQLTDLAAKASAGPADSGEDDEIAVAKAGAAQKALSILQVEAQDPSYPPKSVVEALTQDERDRIVHAKPRKRWGSPSPGRGGASVSPNGSSRQRSAKMRLSSAGRRAPMAGDADEDGVYAEEFKAMDMYNEGNEGDDEDEDSDGGVKPLASRERQGSTKRSASLSGPSGRPASALGVTNAAASASFAIPKIMMSPDDDDDDGGGIPLIRIEAESSQDVRESTTQNAAPIPSLSFPAPISGAGSRAVSATSLVGPTGGGLGSGGASAAVSPMISRASSISCVSSNETDDSFKFSFPIVRAPVHGPLEEDEEEDKQPSLDALQDAAGVPKIVVGGGGDSETASGGRGRSSAVFDNGFQRKGSNRFGSRAGRQASLTGPDSRQGSIVRVGRSRQDSEVGGLGSEGPSRAASVIGGGFSRRRSESLSGGVPGLEALRKRALAGMQDDGGGRAVCIDEDAETRSNGSTTSSDETTSSDDERRNRASKGETDSSKAEPGKAGNPGENGGTRGRPIVRGNIGLKINTKVKSAKELPTAKRRHGSPASALKFYRNPASPNRPREDWELELEKATDALDKVNRKKEKKKKRANKLIKKYSTLINDKAALAVVDPDAQFDEDAIAEAEMRRVLRNLQNWVRSVMGEPEGGGLHPSAPQNTPMTAVAPTASHLGLQFPTTPTRSKSVDASSAVTPGIPQTLSAVAGREFEDLLALSPWKPVMLERGRDRAAILAVESDPPESMLHRIRVNGLLEATANAATAVYSDVTGASANPKSSGTRNPSFLGSRTGSTAAGMNGIGTSSRQPSVWRRPSLAAASRRGSSVSSDQRVARRGSSVTSDGRSQSTIRRRGSVAFAAQLSVPSSKPSSASTTSGRKSSLTGSQAMPSPPARQRRGGGTAPIAFAAPPPVFAPEEGSPGSGTRVSSPKRPLSGTTSTGKSSGSWKGGILVGDSKNHGSKAEKLGGLDALSKWTQQERRKRYAQWYIDPKEWSKVMKMAVPSSAKIAESAESPTSLISELLASQSDAAPVTPTPTTANAKPEANTVAKQVALTANPAAALGIPANLPWDVARSLLKARGIGGDRSVWIASAMAAGGSGDGSVPKSIATAAAAAAAVIESKTYSLEKRRRSRSPPYSEGGRSKSLAAAMLEEIITRQQKETAAIVAKMAEDSGITFGSRRTDEASMKASFSMRSDSTWRKRRLRFKKNLVQVAKSSGDESTGSRWSRMSYGNGRLRSRSLGGATSQGSLYSAAASRDELSSNSGSVSGSSRHYNPAIKTMRLRERRPVTDDDDGGVRSGAATLSVVGRLGASRMPSTMNLTADRSGNPASETLLSILKATMAEAELASAAQKVAGSQAVDTHLLQPHASASLTASRELVSARSSVAHRRSLHRGSDAPVSGEAPCVSVSTKRRSTMLSARPSVMLPAIVGS
ncbi:hypothetical protein HDU96_008205 [Phlyctochytrium bullatum]|nr:hypothetical protein HDU96_008205 [Phlyctochytrium bullatum]